MKISITFTFDTVDRCAVNEQTGDGRIPASREDMKAWIHKTVHSTLETIRSEWEVNHGDAEERKGY